MIKSGRMLGATVAMVATLAAVSACEKPEGPAERAGKEFDKTMDKAGQQIEKAGESIQDTAKGNKK